MADRFSRGNRKRPPHGENVSGAKTMIDGRGERARSAPDLRQVDSDPDRMSNLTVTPSNLESPRRDKTRLQTQYLKLGPIAQEHQLRQSTMESDASNIATSLATALNQAGRHATQHNELLNVHHT